MRRGRTCRQVLLALALLMTPLAVVQARENNPVIVLAIPVPFFPQPRVEIKRVPESFWIPTPGPVSPRTPPPAPRCYAGPVTCDLEQTGLLGGACSCSTRRGTVTGRALIPPNPRLANKSSAAERVHVGSD
jgi:hypothetical protein